jgi:NAD(P)-dependent dehydrogenase (short-subunit alcohol dehydrogenase family)
MSGEFSRKVVVITGGSRGIGREIAVDFARAGAQTIIVSSMAANLAAASKTIAATLGPHPWRSQRTCVRSMAASRFSTM